MLAVPATILATSTTDASIITNIRARLCRMVCREISIITSTTIIAAVYAGQKTAAYRIVAVGTAAAARHGSDTAAGVAVATVEASDGSEI